MSNFRHLVNVPESMTSMALHWEVHEDREPVPSDRTHMFCLELVHGIIQTVFLGVMWHTHCCFRVNVHQKCPGGTLVDKVYQGKV